MSGLILLALLTHSGNWSSAESKHSSPAHPGFSTAHAVCVSAQREWQWRPLEVLTLLLPHLTATSGQTEFLEI